MARGKLQIDPLFPGEGRTGRRPRQWLGVQVERLCERAKVPTVCPHSLRRVSATAAAAAGALPELVAKMLGHTDQSMTMNHYIKAGTSEAVQRERGMLVLTGQPSSPPSLPC